MYLRRRAVLRACSTGALLPTVTQPAIQSILHVASRGPVEHKRQWQKLRISVHTVIPDLEEFQLVSRGFLTFPERRTEMKGLAVQGLGCTCRVLHQQPTFLLSLLLSSTAHTRGQQQWEKTIICLPLSGIPYCYPTETPIRR